MAQALEISSCCLFDHCYLELFHCHLTNRDREVINCTRSCVKTKSKLTNLMKITRIEGYNGKYGSNPQGIREIFYDLFEFNQIG